MKFESKYNTFHSWKCISKWRLLNDNNFSRGIWDNTQREKSEQCLMGLNGLQHCFISPGFIKVLGTWFTVVQYTREISPCPAGSISIWSYICILYNFTTLRWCWWLKPFLPEDQGQFLLCNQHWLLMSWRMKHQPLYWHRYNEIF